MGELFDPFSRVPKYTWTKLFISVTSNKVCVNLGVGGGNEDALCK